MQRFKVKVKYTKQGEDGTFKRVSEDYSLEAMSFTIAEATIYEELGAIIRGEFSVEVISKEDLTEVFSYGLDETWFLCKISFKSEAEEGAKSKNVEQRFLMPAETVKEAGERLADKLKTLMVDYEVKGITKTSYVDVFFAQKF